MMARDGCMRAHDGCMMGACRGHMREREGCMMAHEWEGTLACMLGWAGLQASQVQIKLQPAGSTSPASGCVHMHTLPCCYY